MPLGNVPATSVSSQAFPLLAPNGSVNAPSYSFAGAPNTGFYVAGSSFGVTYAGTLIISSNVSALAFGLTSGTIDIGFPLGSGRRLYIDYTNTGTVGAVTINKATGTVKIAAAGTSVVVTNSLCTVASHFAAPNIRTVDGTAKSATITPAAGSFTITLNAAATGQVDIDFIMVNAD